MQMSEGDLKGTDRPLLSSCRGRSSSLNRSQFLNDLENAMSAGGRQKKRLLSDSAESTPTGDPQSLPFPNR